MKKRWGIGFFLLSSIACFAAADEETPFCVTTAPVKTWQPMPTIATGVVDIEADDVKIAGQQSAHFLGDVNINTNAMRLSAQSALIDKSQGILQALGPLEYQNAASVITSERLTADLNNATLELIGADYQFTNQQGHGGAKKLKITEDTLHLGDASFTTCPEKTPAWSIEASDIILSQQAGWGKTYNAVLKVFDAPVLYLPYFTFPINNKRKTGFLAPEFTSSNRYGAEIVTPYYLNLAPNYDATLTPRYMSNKGLQLQTEFRYLTDTSQGLVGLEYLASDKSEPNLDKRYLFHWQQQSYYGESWRASVDITNVSDDNYLTDLGSPYAIATDTQLARTGSLSYLGERWNTQISLHDFKVLGDHLTPYQALPHIRVAQHTPYQVSWFDVTLDGELSHFRNPERTIDAATRLHLAPKISFSENRYAWSFLSELSLLHTLYRQEGNLTNTQYKKDVSRTLPKLRLYGQLNFERETQWLVDQGTQTLEPRLQYLYVPNKAQNHIGLYDTTKLQDDFFGLFREQRFSGVDRIASANQFTLGATTRIFNKQNEELFNFSVGQIFYLSDSAKPTEQNIGADANYNALLAAETMVHWHRRWYLSGGVQYDMDGKQMIQSHVTLDYKGDNKQLVQLNHRYANAVSGNTIEQVGLFTSLPINKNWQFVGSYHRDIQAGRSVEVFSGIQYESCCWAVRVVARRQIETDLNQLANPDQAKFDSGIGIKFILKGLGGKSSYDAQELLQQGIFGYRRPYFLTN